MPTKAPGAATNHIRKAVIYSLSFCKLYIHTKVTIPTGALDSKSATMLLRILNDLNTRLKATILMVTHDAFSASYCRRILFIKDGKIFNELIRGEETRKEFFDKIINIVSVLGGDESDIL